MKHESSRAFSTLDTLTMIGSLLVLILVIGPILSRRINQQNSVQAARQAQEWTEKIPLDEKLSEAGLALPSQRSLASGSSQGPQAGADPWGQPFQYKFIRNSYGQPVYLAVWSRGPNTQNDTAESGLIIAADGALNAVFQGDDVGTVRSLR